MNRLLSKTDSHLGKTLGYTYDKVGNIQTKTDYQNDATTFSYDGGNRLVAESNPAYLSVSYQYDGAGRLLGRILSNNARTGYAFAPSILGYTPSSVTKGQRSCCRPDWHCFFGQSNIKPR